MRMRIICPPSKPHGRWRREMPELELPEREVLGGPFDAGPMGNVKLTLDKTESLRAIALMMGLRYATDTIIKDPEYLKVMIQREKDAKFSNEPNPEPFMLRPTTVARVVHAAAEFEAFLLGERSA